MAETSDPTQRAPKPRRGFFKRWFRRIAIGFAVLLAAYLIQFARFNLRSPTIATDHEAELRTLLLARNSDSDPIDTYTEIAKEWEVVVEVAEKAITDRGDRPPGSWGWPGKTQFSSIPDLDPDDPTYPDVIAALRAFGPQLDRAIEPAAQPYFGGGLPKPNPSAALIDSPLMTSISDTARIARTIAKLLIADSRLAAQDGDADRAMNSAIAALQLADQCGEQPFVISGLVAISCRSLSVKHLQITLHDHPDLFNSTQLQTISRALPRPNPAPVQFSLETEKRIRDDFIQRLYTDNGRGGGSVAPGGMSYVMRGIPRTTDFDKPVLVARLFGPLASPFMSSRKETQGFYDKFFQLTIQTLENPSLIPQMLKLRNHAMDYYESFGMLGLDNMVVFPGKTATTFIAHQVKVDAARMALAAHRHRLDHGEFPESADGLVPAYLDALPPDPFAPGEPLRYARTDDGLVVYSVGIDGEDNNATPYEGRDNRLVHDLESHAEGRIRQDVQGADWILYPPVQE
ncbi:MAG: hypothetical protein ACI89L_000289 [Phycisphaerales bacterium]|jgi:hypothetical protein